MARIEIFDKEGHRSADPQDDGEEVGELAGEAQQQVLARHFRNVVGAELRQAAQRLDRSQARGRCMQAGERLLCSKALDVHG